MARSPGRCSWRRDCAARQPKMSDNCPVVGTAGDMRRFESSGAGRLVLMVLAALGCSSVENTSAGTGGNAGGGSAGGAGGGFLPDTSCFDGSDGCVWSCAAGPETGSGDSPHAFCDSEGKFRCPTGSQTYSSCPFGSCARRDLPMCCDPVTGRVADPPCKADGFRGACPAGTSDYTSACRPAGAAVTQCVQLDGSACC